MIRHALARLLARIRRRTGVAASAATATASTVPAVSWVGCDVPTVTSGSASATTIHVQMRSGEWRGWIGMGPYGGGAA